MFFLKYYIYLLTPKGLSAHFLISQAHWNIQNLCTDSMCVFMDLLP